MSAAASSLGRDALVGRTIEAAVERQRSAGHTEWLDADALHVVLCGTGSPLPDPTSAAACTAVVAGGRVWVVDVGPGSQEVAQLIGPEDLYRDPLTHYGVTAALSDVERCVDPARPPSAG